MTQALQRLSKFLHRPAVVIALSLRRAHGCFPVRRVVTRNQSAVFYRLPDRQQPWHHGKEQQRYDVRASR